MREHQPATTGIEIRDIKYDYKRGRRMQGTPAACNEEYDKIAPVESNLDEGMQGLMTVTQWGSTSRQNPG